MRWFVAWPARPDPMPSWPPPPRGVHALHPDDLHVTVAFLGAVGETAALRAWDRIWELPVDVLEATLGIVEPMGHPARASALAAQLHGSDGRLVDVIERMRGPLYAAAGALPDTRPARPHLTLARIGRRAGASERAAALAWAASLDCRGCRLRLDRIALYVSVPGLDDGRRYQRVAERLVASGPSG
ncbi:MAG: hypothetical protein NZ898_06025 [Myxococcota bacterium]|nr:hypothetical protein [Myxococcota bacterium]MDW8362169.1 2'-5' RNA ligase family protein [Myxococcales bacterium]